MKILSVVHISSIEKQKKLITIIIYLQKYINYNKYISFVNCKNNNNN